MKAKFCLFAWVLLLSSCTEDDWGPRKLAYGAQDFDQASLEKGRIAYETYCIGCHGDSGDGEGPAARFMNPKPRNLQLAKVKFASVPAGSLPRDEDLLRTITFGLSGTAMPAFPLLSEEERMSIILYIKTFSDDWGEEVTDAPVPIDVDPWQGDPEEGIAEGERVYHGIAGCWNCHPAYVSKPRFVELLQESNMPLVDFRENFYQSIEKESDWGLPILPTDFLFDPIKMIPTRENIVRVIATGIGGTAMPTWGESLTTEQLWGLAYYIKSLAKLRNTTEAKELQEELFSQPPYTSPQTKSASEPTSNTTNEPLSQPDTNTSREE